MSLPLHGDARGWLKENWHRTKMVALGLPDFAPIQHNISYNAASGVTRGFHAEPWDKFVSIASGRVFCAWLDLREGPTFGRTVTLELGPDTAVFVPRGVANSFQTLEPSVYSYLLNGHWSPTASYSHVNLADPTLAIEWPIPLSDAVLSEADRHHPLLADIAPIRPRLTAVVGATGQLGRALLVALPDAVGITHDQLDLTDVDAVAAFDWSRFDTIINAAAYTRVDEAESATGRAACWAINVTGVGTLVAAARSHNCRLVQVSSDYVFDGTMHPHAADEALSPLGVYGQSKAAGEALAATWPDHLIVRTSWLIGDGANFVTTMLDLAERDAQPSVVADQHGRLTFADDLAAAIVHLLSIGASGVWQVSNGGPAQSWHDIAAKVFALAGRDASDVVPVSTAEYASGRQLAPRPTHSAFDLAPLVASGFQPPDADARLVSYVTARRR